MKNYRINALQYHTLTALLKVTQQSMKRTIGCSTNYMSRHLRDGEFKMNDALAICNAYHIKLSVFVTTLSAEDAKIASSIVWDGEWEDIRYTPAAIHRVMTRDGISMTDIMEVTGWGRETVKGLFKTDVPMKKLLEFCNAFGLNLDEFVSDSTLPRLTTSGQDLKKENEILRDEIRKLRQELYEMKARMNESPYEYKAAEEREVLKK